MIRNSERTILVTGSTGHQGNAVFQQLRKRSFKLRALVRDTTSEKARQLMGHGEEVFQGDLDDPESLPRALEAVYGVYSVQPYTDDAATEIKQGVSLIEAASQQNISRFVYSSVASADENTGIAHFESKGKIEDHLRSSGLSYTILRPVFFMENWQSMFAEPIARGEINLPLSPSTKLQMVAVNDIGSFAVQAFEHADKWHNRTVSLAGDQLSMEEIAAAFSRITARPVRYAQVPWEQFEQKAGHELTVMYRWFEERGYSADLDGVRREYPQTMTFNHWLEAYWGASTGASV